MLSDQWTCRTLLIVKFFCFSMYEIFLQIFRSTLCDLILFRLISSFPVTFNGKSSHKYRFHLAFLINKWRLLSKLYTSFSKYFDIKNHRLKVG